MLSVIDIQPGDAPLIVNVPHDGREIPAEIGATMTAEALALRQTRDSLIRASLVRHAALPGGALLAMLVAPKLLPFV